MIDAFETFVSIILSSQKKIRQIAEREEKVCFLQTSGRGKTGIDFEIWLKTMYDGGFRNWRIITVFCHPPVKSLSFYRFRLLKYFHFLYLLRKVKVCTGSTHSICYFRLNLSSTRSEYNSLFDFFFFFPTLSVLKNSNFKYYYYTV